MAFLWCCNFGVPSDWNSMGFYPFKTCCFSVSHSSPELFTDINIVGTNWQIFVKLNMNSMSLETSSSYFLTFSSTVEHGRFVNLVGGNSSSSVQFKILRFFYSNLWKCETFVKSLQVFETFISSFTLGFLLHIWNWHDKLWQWITETILLYLFKEMSTICC